MSRRSAFLCAQKKENGEWNVELEQKKKTVYGVQVQCIHESRNGLFSFVEYLL